MNKRYDICSPRPRKNSDKPFWHRVGTAFEGEKGLSLVFDSLPLPDAEGRTVVKLFEQRERDGSQGSAQPPQRDSRNSYADDLSDEIPF